MKWLLWKEYRLNRLILIVGAMLLFAPHAVALANAWQEGIPFNRHSSYADPNKPNLASDLLDSVLMSLAVSQLMMGLIGGHAIAGERADRSAEFLAYLPVSRIRTLAGKIVLPLLCAALIWVSNLLILYFALADLPPPHARWIEGMWVMLGFIASSGLLCFSVGWLLSSILDSPTFAIGGGLVTPFLIMLGLLAPGWWFTLPEENYWRSYLYICLALSPVCFIAGTWYYLRRVEP